MSALGWLSRIVLGRVGTEEARQAQQHFYETINGASSKADPEVLRKQLGQILAEVEEKAAALSAAAGKRS